MITDTTEVQELKKGDKVHYTAPHGTKENGIVKELNTSNSRMGSLSLRR